jgi:hypothetical protein
MTDFVKRLEKVLRYSVHSCLLDRDNRIFTLEIFTFATQTTSGKITYNKYGI